MRHRGQNSQSQEDREQLLTDFARRLEHASSRSILRRPGSIAIVVHPTADETALLQELGISPRDCIGVDAYWQYGDSVYWIEVHGSRFAAWEPGIYYRFDTNRRRDVFRVVLTRDIVTSADLHHALDLLQQHIDGGDLGTFRSSAKREQTIRVADLPSELAASE